MVKETSTQSETAARPRELSPPTTDKVEVWVPPEKLDTVTDPDVQARVLWPCSCSRLSLQNMKSADRTRWLLVGADQKSW